MVMDAGIRLTVGEAGRAVDLAQPGRLVRRVHGLFDLAVVVARDGGLSTPDQAGRSMDGAELAQVVRDRGGEGQDVRVLVAAEEHALAALVALASHLGRDVLACPAGSEPHVLPSVNSAGASTPGDIVPVDLVSGRPVGWTVIRPDGAAGPGWYEVSDGTVTERTGLVVVALPGGGVALATRDTFVRRRSEAAELGSGHPNLVTVAVDVRSGDFVVGDYSGRSISCDGRALAVALAAVPLDGRDVRMWLRWPEVDEERRRLRRGLLDLAEMIGTDVWAPVEGSRVEILEGCRDLGVVAPDGRPGRWKRVSDGGGGRFESDVDGRLVPVGGVVSAAGVGYCSVDAPPAGPGLASLAPASTGPANVDGRKSAGRLDLAVLADGRLALRYRDGVLLAAGSRQVVAMLRRAGWPGGDVTLLPGVDGDRAAHARRHAEVLGAAILQGVANGEQRPVSFPDSAQVRPAPISPATGAAPSGLLGWCWGAQAQPIAVPEPPSAADIRAAAKALAAVRALEDAYAWADAAAGRAAAGSSPARVAPARSAADVIEPLDQPPSRFIDGPRIGPAARRGARHGLSWLPAQPQVNQEECDLFVWCSAAPERAARDGVPGLHLFLLAHLDRDRLASKMEGGWVLRVRVGPGAAVDVAASDSIPPPEAPAELSDPDTYLLPPGWLDRCRIVSAYRVGPDGKLAKEYPLAGEAELTIRSEGGWHGVPGIPDEVERWPAGRVRSAVTRLIAVNGAAPDPLGTWQRLHQHRPPAVAEHRLLQVRVERHRSIDVAATLASLAGLTSVRTHLRRLADEGVDFLLPVASYPHVTVTHEFHSRNGRWQPISRSTSRTLDTWTPA
jgi:hypothetical protein